LIKWDAIRGVAVRMALEVYSFEFGVCVRLFIWYWLSNNSRII